jgi:aryl-alcohol dehydrogenase-like predicted oxidoreductase
LLSGERAFETASRFTLSVPGVNTAIVGTRDPAHLLQNIEYAEARCLDQAEFATIRHRWKEVAEPDWTDQV